MTGAEHLSLLYYLIAWLYHTSPCIVVTGALPLSCLLFVYGIHCL